MNTPKKQNSFILVFSLGLICAIATGLLVYVYELTKGPIAEGKAKKITLTLSEILPEFANNPSEKAFIIGTLDGETVIEFESKLKADNKLDSLKNKITFYPAYNAENKLVAVAGQSKSKGFDGYIHAMVGLDVNGTILTVEETKSAVKVTKHTETPGLGTKITDRSRTKDIFEVLGIKDAPPVMKIQPNAVLDSYRGKTADGKEWKVVKDGGDCDFISGATISSRGICNIAYNISSAFAKNKDLILAKLSEQK